MADNIGLNRLQKIVLKYTWASGRIDRLQFVGRLLGILMGAVATMFIMYVVCGNKNLSFLTFMIATLLQWFILCSIGKRTHDLGYSARWSLLFWIPIVNIIYLFILLLVPGNKGENRYGAPPLDKRKKVKIATVLTIFLLFAGISIIDYCSARSVHPVKGITYAELLQDVEDQQVNNVIIFSDNNFKGTLKTNEIVITKIPAEHSDLIKTLQRQNVNIKYEEAPKPPWWRAFFLGIKD